MKKNVKQDINFLEVSNFCINSRNNEVHVLVDEEGFRYEAHAGVPTRTDSTILYALLAQSQHEGYNPNVRMRLSEIVRMCGMPRTNERYDRIRESLKKWSNTTMEYKGTFYDGKEYKSMFFRYVNQFKEVEGENVVEVQLNDLYLEVVRYSAFFIYLAMPDLVKLKSPIAYKLYGLLAKTFYKRETWQIGAQKLAKKMGIQQPYYSGITRKIEQAVDQINEKTQLELRMTTRKKAKNDGLITFKKIKGYEKNLLELMKHESELESANRKEREARLKEEHGALKKIMDLLSALSDAEQKDLQQEFINSISSGPNKNHVIYTQYRRHGLQRNCVQAAYHQFIRNKYHKK